jgi:hypothetical protein
VTIIFVHLPRFGGAFSLLAKRKNLTPGVRFQKPGVLKPLPTIGALTLQA